MGLPTMTRLTSLRRRLLAANHSAKPLRFFTLSKRAILQRTTRKVYAFQRSYREPPKAAARSCHAAENRPKASSHTSTAHQAVQLCTFCLPHGMMNWPSLQDAFVQSTGILLSNASCCLRTYLVITTMWNISCYLQKTNHCACGAGVPIARVCLLFVCHQPCSLPQQQHAQRMLS